jgi:hypothetical protein
MAASHSARTVSVQLSAKELKAEGSLPTAWFAEVFGSARPASYLLLGVLLRAFVLFDPLAQDLAVAGVHDDLAAELLWEARGFAHDLDLVDDEAALVLQLGLSHPTGNRIQGGRLGRSPLYLVRCSSSSFSGSCPYGATSAFVAS